MSDQESVRINIFGVGRSGTKAVQLWFSYLLAKKYGEVLVNYEPLRYQSKSLGPNHWGRRIHRSLPMLASEEKHSAASIQSFGESLIRYPIVVSKFIRATGRINLINSATRPDLSILVIRDLYQVLQSVGRLTWNLFDNEKDWLRLHRQGIKTFPQFEKKLSQLSQYDKLLTNATYWFLMNKYALDHLENTIVVSYQDLGALEQHAEMAGLETEGTTLKDPLFKGGRIHRKIPLEEVERSSPSLLTRVSGFAIPNRLRSELSARFSRRAPGSLCRINPDTPERFEDAGPKVSIRPKISIEPNPLFDEMAQLVNEGLSAALARQEAEL